MADTSFVAQQIAALGHGPSALIPLLQAIQNHYHYLPPEVLQYVAQHADVPPAAVTAVATFYAQFRLKPAGKHILRVCHGTACHVKGSELIDDALRRELKLSPGQDTDAAGNFTIERVGCIGCCTLAPVVQVDKKTVGHVRSDGAPQLLTLADAAPPTDEDVSSPAGDPRTRDLTTEIRIGMGSCCVAGGSGEVRAALEETAAELGVRPTFKPIGCTGMCHQTPMVEVLWDKGKKGSGQRYYTHVTASTAREIVRAHYRPRGIIRNIRELLRKAEAHFLPPETDPSLPVHTLAPHDARDPELCEFLGRQKRIATENAGTLHPLDLEEYLAHDGFKAYHSLPTPAEIVDIVTVSGLRGRGGAGFPTGKKWAAVRAATGDKKYVICNGDEGDPGAFMDRMILESYPFRVIEGMAIAAKAVGAKHAVFYIRAEYALALERITKAIELCTKRELLPDLTITIKQGAGAIVCGEETALIASIEGRRGMPTLRPPYPAEKGLWGKPTLINNVETYALIPWIFRHGAAAFASIGTAKSKGTKVFALTGKIRRGGLIEVPMGTTIRQIVEEIGGGVEAGRKFKAVQIGGPSGGCVPASLVDTSVDYESLASVGSIMGSGGLVVLDDRDCMVDIARYFLSFTQAESCGKCTFCRVGTKRMLEILTRFTTGKATPKDLDELDFLAGEVKQGSLCGLGQTAPNPVLSTLRYFRDEYEAHLRGECPAGKCKDLIHYTVSDKCIGCTKCVQVCPSNSIPFTPYAKHTIDSATCTRCDICRTVCPENAIDIISLARTKSPARSAAPSAKVSHV